MISVFYVKLAFLSVLLAYYFPSWNLCFSWIINPYDCTDHLDTLASLIYRKNWVILLYLGCYEMYMKPAEVF